MYKRLIALLTACLLMASCLPAVAESHSHPSCGASCSHSITDAVRTWEPWDGSFAISQGNYYLTQDVTITESITVLDDTALRLCLNGHTLFMNGNKDTFILNDGALMTLTDCQANQGTLRHTARTTGRAFKVVGNSSGLDTKLYIYGGNISYNSAPAGEKGAALYIDRATVNMYGGEISYNTGDADCGAVYITGQRQGSFYSDFAMYENAAVRYNYGIGGVRAEQTVRTTAENYPRLYMYNGVIENNTATHGGGVALYGYAEAWISNGVIQNNSAVYGGGVYVGEGQHDKLNSSEEYYLEPELYLCGGSIKNNSATYGGGAYSESHIYQTDYESEVSGNFAEYGGGFYASESFILMLNANIQNNTATVAGGGILMGGADTDRANRAVLRLSSGSANNQYNIINNTVNGTANNVHLGNGAYISQAGQPTAPNIGVTVDLNDDGTYAFTGTGFPEAKLQYYTSDQGYTKSIVDTRGTMSRVYHSVSVSASNGTVTPSKSSGLSAGDRVTLTVTPAEGYQLKSLTAKDASGNEVTISYNQFYMPGSSVTVTAVFELIPVVTHPITCEVVGSGTVTADKETAEAGETVTLTVTPAEGYRLKSLTANGDAVTGTTFTMPDEDVKVVAEFEAIPSYSVSVVTRGSGSGSVDKPTAQAGETVTISMTPAAGFVSNGYEVYLSDSGDYVPVTNNQFTMPAGNVTVMLYFAKAPAYAVTCEAVGSGTVTADKETAEAGETVTLTVTPAEGYRLKSLTANGDAVTGTSFTMPDADVKVVAEFEAIPSYSVSVVTRGSGSGSVDKPTAQAGETVTISMTPAAGFVSNGYEVYLSDSGDYVPVTNNQFTMPAGNVTVMLYFAKAPAYAVTCEAVGSGTVTADKETAEAGETVTLTVTPAEGYRLKSLTANGDAVTGTTFTMPDADVKVVAEFELIPVTLYAITCEVVGSGTVTADKETAEAGETVTLAVTPAEGYRLKSLTANGDAVTGTSFTMPDADVKVVAEFELIPVYAISVTPTRLDFGTLIKGQPLPAAQTVTVENTGNAAVSLGYSLNALGFNCDMTQTSSLAPGATATVRVSAAPQADFTPGVYSGTLIIKATPAGNAARSDSAEASVDLTYTLAEAPRIPQTGDDSLPLVWLVLLMGAFLLMPKRRLN